jgi:hypothetical protein
MIVSNSPENTLYDPGDVVESSYLFSLSEISSTLTFQLLWNHLPTSRIEHSVNAQTFFLGYLQIFKRCNRWHGFPPGSATA